MEKIFKYRKSQLCFLLMIMFLLNIMMAPLPVFSNDDEDDEEEENIVKISSVVKGLTDISSQYRPTSTKNSYSWFLENAEAEELIETLQSVFASEIEENTLRIVHNPYSNAIIFSFKNEELAKVYRESIDLLKYLDKKPSQVLIEVLIAEVTLTDNKDVGFNYRYNGNNFNKVPGLDSKIEIDNTFLQDDADVAGRTLALNGAKLSLGKTDRVKGFIHGLITDNQLQVVSSPKIIATNNQEAKISIGNTVPIITGTTVTDNNKTTNTYTDFEAKMELTVTPLVGANGNITLSILQSLDELGEYDTKNKTITKTQRELETTLSLSDNQTAVLGGFIKETKRNISSSVPYLSNIPYLGKIFNKNNTITERKELMIFITPKLLECEQDGDYVTENIKNTLQYGDELDELLDSREVRVPEPGSDTVILVEKSSDGWFYTGVGKEIDRIINELPIEINASKIFTRKILKGKKPSVTPFGYGRVRYSSCMYNTKLTPDVSYAFIRQFEIDDPEAIKSLNLRVASDNAAVIYINGKLADVDPEIRTVSGHDFELWNRNIDYITPELLRKGKNYIIGFVKNEENSNEAYFDLELRGKLKINKNKLTELFSDERDRKLEKQIEKIECIKKKPQVNKRKVKAKKAGSNMKKPAESKMDKRLKEICKKYLSKEKTRS